MSVDWTVIKADWEKSGDSFRKLGEKYGISQQAISKRAKRDGWQEEHGLKRQIRMPNWKKLVLETEVAGYGDARNTGIVKLGDYPGVLTQILKNICKGGTDKLAAEAEGIGEVKWKEWLGKDKRLKELVMWARSIRASARVQAIDAAADRGDWRASSYLLERDPHTRDDFKKPDEHAGAIQIILNVPRTSFAETAKVIEGELDEDRTRLPSE